MAGRVNAAQQLNAQNLLTNNLLTQAQQPLPIVPISVPPIPIPDPSPFPPPVPPIPIPDPPPFPPPVPIDIPPPVPPPVPIDIPPPVPITNPPPIIIPTPPATNYIQPQPTPVDSLVQQQIQQIPSQNFATPQAMATPSQIFTGNSTAAGQTTTSPSSFGNSSAAPQTIMGASSGLSPQSTIGTFSGAPPTFNIGGSSPNTNLPTAPPTALPPPVTENASMEQQALRGGHQQVSNFMNALNRSGQGRSNNLMNDTAQQGPNYQPYVPSVGANNGSSAPNQMVAQNGLNAPIQSAGSIQGSSYLGSSSQAPVNMAGTNTPGYYNTGNTVPIQPDTSGTSTTGVGTVDQGLTSYNPNTGGLNGGYNPFTSNGGIPQNYQNFGTGGGPGSTTGGGPVTPPTGLSGNGGLTQQVGTPLPVPIPTVAPGKIPNSRNASDENLKENIKSAKGSIQDFLDNIHAHSYEYKDKQDGIGTFTTPMAQELEKSELGKQAVIDTPRGKMVDYGRLGGVNLAAVSVVHREQQKLQKQIDQLRREFKGKK